MFSGRYRIADVNIEIVSLYETVQKMCADYATSDEPSIRIVITEADVEKEAKHQKTFTTIWYINTKMNK